MSPDQEKAWRDGYAAGFKAATLANHDKSDAKQRERRRILAILNATAQTLDIQRVIDKINEEV